MAKQPAGTLRLSPDDVQEAEAAPLCSTPSSSDQGPSGTRGFQRVALWAGLGLLVAAAVLAVTVLYLGGLQQLDPRRNTAVTTPATPLATSTPRTVFHPKTQGEERLAVCCHHVTAFNVQPNVSWGQATLEQQGIWMKWNCDDVLQRHLGNLEDASSKCRALGAP